jgi:L-2-hydroxycarboxylate dehydrogenase (NAD+)
MAQIEMSELRALVANALKTMGVGTADAAIIADDLIEAEEEGKSTHGLGKLFVIDEALAKRTGNPEIVKLTSVAAVIDGKGELGQVAATFAVKRLIALARGSGIGIVALRNISRYGRLSPYGRQIAAEGFVGIVMNGGGPPAVAPYGGIDPVLGTNPICFAFPQEGEPLIADFSTAERVWGEIRQAMLAGTQLPENAFIDETGQFTRDPARANAVLPFGAHKGYALGLALEILTGALTGAEVGTAVKTPYDLGYLFIAIDPSLLASGEVFRKSVSNLVDDIEASRPRTPGTKVRAPGSQSRDRRKSTRAAGVLDVADDMLDKLRRLANGERGILGATARTD